MKDFQRLVKFEVLQRRVRWIAMACICVNILWSLFVLVYIVTSLNETSLTGSPGNQRSLNQGNIAFCFWWELFRWKIKVGENIELRIIGNWIGNVIGIAICILLYLGATIGKSHFLIPFMLYISLALVGLSVVLLDLCFYFIEFLNQSVFHGYCYNECELYHLILSIPIIFFIAITYWMLKTINALWIEIRKNSEFSKNGVTVLELSDQISINDAQKFSHEYQHREIPYVSAIDGDQPDVLLPESSGDETNIHRQKSNITMQREASGFMQTKPKH